MKFYKSKYFISMIACLICITCGVIVILKSSNSEGSAIVKYDYNENEIVTEEIFFNITKQFFADNGHDISALIDNNPETNETISRQNVYSILVQYINETSTLRNLCYPTGISIEEGTQTTYFKKLFKGEIIPENNSFHNNILSNQMKQAALMNVVSYEYSSGNTIRIFAWDSKETKERYIDFFDDFENVKENNVQRVLQACEIGIVDKFFNNTGYEIYLRPDENIKVYELKDIMNRIINIELRVLPDVIQVTSFAGDEFDYDEMSLESTKVYLRLSNKALIMAANELSKYMGENEQSYIGLDTNGISYCLWFNSIKYGTLHIPLNYPNEPAYIDLNENDVDNNDVLFGFSLFLPEKFRETFINWVHEGVINGGNAVNLDMNGITSYIASTSEKTYTVFIS